MTPDTMEPPQSGRVFLTAEWRNLVMLNYAVNPDLLARFVPCGTVLDSFENKTYLSLVGFQFCQTKLFGVLPVPFHTNFPEVNLRFYVRRSEDGEERRGVVFIAEIVPRRAIATTARLLYQENYHYAAMKYRVDSEAPIRSAEFQWRVNGQWCRLAAQTRRNLSLPGARSLEEFITEHYWGYSARLDGRSLEYRVSHPQWQVASADVATFDGDVRHFYGDALAAVLQRIPESAFVAEGSPVTVFRGSPIS